MLRTIDKVMFWIVFFMIFMALANESYGKENQFNLRLGVYTNHLFSGGYDVLKENTKQFKNTDYSYYTVERKPYNENNKLVSIEYKNVLIATFENSYYNRSYYIAYNVMDLALLKSDYGNISFKAYMGLTKGYIRNKHIRDYMCFTANVCYQATVGFEYEYKNFTTSVTMFGEALNVSIGKAFSIN